MSSKQRKATVERIREHGRLAYLAGKSLQSCPYQGADARQWRKAWHDAQHAAGEAQDASL